MKKVNFLMILMAVIMLAAMSACKKDSVIDTSLKVEGQWQIDSINFLSDSAQWDRTVEFTEGNYFGYAPAMFGGMQGFDFITTTTSGGEGKKFNFIEDGSGHLTEGVTYWYWNLIEGGKGLEIEQINKSLPPFDFSIMNITNIVQSADGKKLTFRAEVNSRLSGKSLAKMVIIPVEFTLTKATPSTFPTILINGVVMEDPSKNIVGKHWKLKPGSDIYDPSMSDTDDSTKAYLKLLAINLDKTDTLLYRYTYPLGIISTKKYAQTLIDDDILEIKLGGSFGAALQVIQFHIEDINIADGELKLKELKTGAIRNFIKIESIESGLSKSDYNTVTP